VLFIKGNDSDEERSFSGLQVPQYSQEAFLGLHKQEPRNQPRGRELVPRFRSSWQEKILGKRTTNIYNPAITKGVQRCKKIKTKTQNKGLIWADSKKKKTLWKKRSKLPIGMQLEEDEVAVRKR